MKVFLLSFLLLCPLFISAQRFTAGMGGGIVLSDIPGADEKTNFRKVGFTAGGVVAYQLNTDNFLQFEISYTMKGSSQRGDSLGFGHHRLGLHYVDIPVLFRHMRHPRANDDGIRPGFEIGISYGRLLAYRVLVNNYTQSYDDSYFNRNELAGVIGVGFFDNAGKGSLTLRFSHGITPALRRNPIQPGFYAYSYNQGINLVVSATLKVMFGKKGE